MSTIGGSGGGGVPLDPTIWPHTFANQLTDDLPTFFNSAEFAREASYEPQGKGSFFINGFFDETPSIPEIFSQRQSINPRFRTSSSPLTKDAAKGDFLVINDKAYFVTAVRHDGQGTTTLELSLDPDGPD